MSERLKTNPIHAANPTLSKKNNIELYFSLLFERLFVSFNMPLSPVTIDALYVYKLFKVSE